MNHMSPSGPAASGPTRLYLVGIVYSVIAPMVVIRASLSISLNQRAPSGAAAIWSPTWEGVANSVMEPLLVMRPILLGPDSTNHTASSGPAAIPVGRLFGVGIPNSV